MRGLWIALGVGFVLAACSDAPFCGAINDATGRPVVFCPGPRDEPVCDFEDDRARFELGRNGYALVGGARASCSTERRVVCPPGTVGEPYCLLDPEL